MWLGINGLRGRHSSLNILRNVTIAPGTHSRKAGEPRSSRAKVSFNFLRYCGQFLSAMLGGAEVTRGGSVISQIREKNFFPSKIVYMVKCCGHCRSSPSQHLEMQRRHANTLNIAWKKVKLPGY